MEGRIGSTEGCLDMGAGESSIISSSSSSFREGVEIGVGDVISTWLQKGALCGRGDISIVSNS